MTILVSISSIVVILTSIDSILEKCVHLQVQYSRVLSLYSQVLKQIRCISKLVVDHYREIGFMFGIVTLAGDHIFQVLGQYL